MYHLLVFILGLCVGSFLNAVVHRLKTGEGILGSRSYCPACGRELSFLDLIPVFSFLLLRGRCRYCGERISWQYPLVEIGTGVLFVLTYLNFSCSSSYPRLRIAYYLSLVSFLVVIFVYDLKHYIIPDKIVYPALILTFLYRVFTWVSLNQGIEEYLVSAFGAAGFFLLIYLLSRGEWMGFGDVKLAFLMGLVLGYSDTVTALFTGVVLGALTGTLLVLLGKKKWKSKVPFGPFLVAGTLISIFWGQEIINTYFNLFILL